MTKVRIKTTKDTRELVLKEFRYRCAICGKDSPQIHHIDENPGNNDPMNLLPLCPNHHLSDQHDPTRQIDPMLLTLFRKFKDPQILSSRFEPVFRRLKPLLRPAKDKSFNELAGSAIDLAAFISRFSMGAYYYNRLSDLLCWAHPSEFTAEEAHSIYEIHLRLYLERLEQNTDQVIALLVEQLRYQDWPSYEA